MGIFNYDLLNEISSDRFSSEMMDVVGKDWKMFQSFFPHMGAMYYEAGSETGFMDDNCFRILRITKPNPNGAIPRKEFLEIIQEITHNPLSHSSHIYRYAISGKNHLLRITLVPWGKEHCWLGFLQDTTSSGVDYSARTTEHSNELDPLTKLPVRDAFLRQFLERIQNDRMGILVAIHIHGIDAVSNELGYGKGDRCLISVANILAKFRTDQILIGVKAYKEFYLYLPKSDVEVMKQYLKSIENALSLCTITDEFGTVISTADRQNMLSLTAGYYIVNEIGFDCNVLVDKVNFSLHEALQKEQKYTPFSEEHFQSQMQEWVDIQQVKRIVSDNLLEYHFQPIVSARNGEIVAYEALLRVTDRSMSITDILSVAEKINYLSKIEHHTVFNTMQVINQAQSIFENKSLYINIIPGKMISEQDFEYFLNTYGELCRKLVIEVTEHTPLDEATLSLIRNRTDRMNAKIAIDDYGTGYSNTGSLLRCMPSIVKVDRELIQNIDTDSRKQRLFTDLACFCHENGIKVLAEGVETISEIKSVISLGADLLQGYFISRPKPLFLQQLSEEVVEQIINANLDATKSYDHKLYICDTNEPLDLSKLILEKYTDVKIVCPEATVFCSDMNHSAKFSIHIADDLRCRLNLYGININGINRPTIQIGNNAVVIISLENDNYLSYAGILVPESSALRIEGKGNLEIDASTAETFGIGNNSDHGYGVLSIRSTGLIKINANGDYSVGIGGGCNPKGNAIDISGEIHISSTALANVCIGSHDGKARININQAKLRLQMASASTAGIGSLRDNAQIRIQNSDITIQGSGTRILGVGVLEQGSGGLEISRSRMEIDLHGRYVTCLGTNEGDLDVHVKEGRVRCVCEGSDLTGIGDRKGSGDVVVSECKTEFIMSGPVKQEIGSLNGNVTIK